MFELFDILSTLTVYPTIAYPLRNSDHNATSIDNIFRKLSQSSIKSTTEILLEELSGPRDNDIVHDAFVIGLL